MMENDKCIWLFLMPEDNDCVCIGSECNCFVSTIGADGHEIHDCGWKFLFLYAAASLRQMQIDERSRV
jgi:hypothetical protein